MRIDFPSAVIQVLGRLQTAGFEACVAGGCVRDALLGCQPNDYDIACSASPEQVQQLFADCRVIETGIQHGTVTVLMDGMPIEITTFRGGPTLADDLRCRDFTINAMACHLDGTLTDLFGGQEDLQSGVIRCVQDADARFVEDPLRMLRALRFASQLDFQIEEATLRAAQNHRHLLLNVAVERIAAEFIKLLCGPAVHRVLLEHMDVIGVFLPEALPMQHFDQCNYHHIYDVLEHTAHAVSHTPPVPALRLAAFFHDIGKPHCFTQDDQGVGHFYGHSAISMEMASRVMKRLKLDNATRERVEVLVKYHDRQIEPTPQAVKRALSKLTPPVFEQLLLLKRADNAAQSPVYDRRAYYDELDCIAADVQSQPLCLTTKHLAVNGHDLMGIGLSGTQIGRVQKQLLDSVIDGCLPNEKTALLQRADELQKMQRL